MKDSKILDRVVDVLDVGYLVYKNGDGRSYSYISASLDERGGFAPEPSEEQTARWVEITREMAEWIKAERADEALKQRIRAEVAYQIKKQR